MNTRKIIPAVGMLLVLVPVGIAALVLSSTISTSDAGNPSRGKRTPPAQPWVSPTPDPNTLAVLQHSRELWDLLYTQPGTIVAEGTSTTPIGLYNLTTYRIEELTLPRPLSFYVREGSKQVYPDAETSVADPRVVEGWKTVTVSTLWRVLVSGDFSKQVGGSLTWSLSVDGAPIGTMPLVLYDKSVLHEGGTIAIAYGGGFGAELPDKIHYLTTK